MPTGVHWRGIDPEVHLGYRKGKRGGVWLVRWRDGIGYRQTKIGTADDVLGEGTLDYSAAAKLARETVQKVRADANAAEIGPALRVEDVVKAYVGFRDKRELSRTGRVTLSDAGRRLGKHVIGAPTRGKRKEVPAADLSRIKLHELTEADLRSWRNSLPKELKQTSVRRLINDLKAALNAGYMQNRERLPPGLPAIIKLGLKLDDNDGDHSPVARENQILTDEEVSRLIEAANLVDREEGWESDLYNLVLLLAATGARFSQVIRIGVGDVQPDAGRVLVPVSRKGRSRKTGSIPVPVGEDVLQKITPLTRGRDPQVPLLERWRHEQVPGSIRWRRAKRGPWRSASELLRPWGQIRERAGLPDAIPYALRHTSIVRGVRANLPLRLVAGLHDTSTEMIERHYSKWIVDGLEDLARKAIVPLAEVGNDVS